VWSVIGGLAQATERLVIGTGVTCPTMRIHPAVVAQAAATSAAMLEPLLPRRRQRGEPERARGRCALAGQESGLRHPCIHQVGPDQDGFMRFYQREILPMFARRHREAA